MEIQAQTKAENIAIFRKLSVEVQQGNVALTGLKLSLKWNICNMPANLETNP